MHQSAVEQVKRRWVRDRKRHLTWILNINPNAAKSFTAKWQFRPWKRHKSYQNPLLGICNLDHLNSLCGLSWWSLCSSTTGSEFTFFLGLKVFMQAATKIMFKVNTPTPSLHLSVLILSCCQFQKQSHAKRNAHRHIQQSYKHGLKRWTCLTDWLFSLSWFSMSLCFIHSC